jgi:DNA polymerase-3 subunit delta'
MSFNNVIGQEKAKQALRQALENDRLAHAILLYGPEGVGKRALAIELAKAVNCTQAKGDGCDLCSSCHKISSLQHPDLKVIFPGPAQLQVEEEISILQKIAEDNYQAVGFAKSVTISIDKIRELRKQASYHPYEGKRKVAILLGADQMRPEAANALLKILEEPPGTLLLILTAINLNSLLPTILSRCQRLQLNHLSRVEIEEALLKRKDVSPEKAKIVAGLTNGNLTRALSLAAKQDLDEYRNIARALLEAALWGNNTEKLSLIETIIAEKDKARLEYLLELVLLWLRDTLLWGEDRQDKITNIDRSDETKKIAEWIDSKEVARLSREVESSLEMMSRNVNPELILIGLVEQMSTIGVKNG